MRKIYINAVKILLIFALFLAQNISSAIEDTPQVPRMTQEEMEASGEIYVTDVEVVGNNLVNKDFILSQMTTKPGYIYDKKTIVTDLNKIYKTGFFTQKIRAIPLKNDENKNVVLRIVVEENPPIKDFTIEGNDMVDDGEILNILTGLEGMPQNVITINQAIERIQELYAVKGYILSRITSMQDDPDGTVNIVINEGIIQDVVVEGNYKTKDFIVKRNMLLEPGSVYNENTTRNDILKLMGTQAFSDVTRDIKMDPETGKYIVTVNLEEQRTGKVSVGVGIDSSSGFFGSVGFGENNFRGLGQKLNLNLMAGTGVLMSDDSILRRANFQAELSFLEPYFKNERNSLGYRAYFRSLGSYQVPLSIENRFGLEATLSRRFTAFKNLSGSIAFGVENVSMKEGDEGKMRQIYAAHHVPWSMRDEQLKGGFFFKATPTLVYDTRDNIINPRHGGIASISLEEAFNFTDFEHTYGKVTGAIKKYIPFGRKSSIMIAAKGGGKLNGNMPEFASFRLGGPYTIRGFNISEVGTGDGFMMATAEFRTPIPFIDRLTTNNFLNNIRLAAFVDGGKIFNPTITDSLYNRPGYAISAGVGLRVFIPGLGAVNFDYGIPLTNTKGINRSGGFFTFGMGDMLY